MLDFREGTCHKIYRPLRRENDPILRETNLGGSGPECSTSMIVGGRLYLIPFFLGGYLQVQEQGPAANNLILSFVLSP